MVYAYDLINHVKYLCFLSYTIVLLIDSLVPQQFETKWEEQIVEIKITSN